MQFQHQQTGKHNSPDSLALVEVVFKRYKQQQVNVFIPEGFDTIISYLNTWFLSDRLGGCETIGGSIIGFVVPYYCILI